MLQNGKLLEVDPGPGSCAIGTAASARPPRDARFHRGPSGSSRERISWLRSGAGRSSTPPPSSPLRACSCSRSASCAKGRRSRARQPESSGSRLLLRAHWPSAATFERERQNETLRALLIAPDAAPGHLRRQADRHSVGPRGRVPRGPARRVDVSGAAARTPRSTDARSTDRRHDWVCRRGDAVRGDARARPQPRRAAADSAVSDDRSRSSLRACAARPR